MNLSGWEFKEKPWWNMDSQSIRFAVEKNGIRKVCAIPRIALNDYFKTEDSREAAFANYAEHADMIHSLAVRLIQPTELKKQGAFRITREHCAQYWP